ncbi:MAG: cyclic nucleotide-binding domain-containing protein [Candidatus Marinimicrobia bacterium]|nr:cyclic nucleotide-binding domain-containing protein [Candidatus Neomarinimicrobiota bacterium]
MFLDKYRSITQLKHMRNGIWENIFKRKNRELSETAFALRNVPIFSSLSKRELREIERLVHHREYTSGEVIFNHGDPGLGMYIIIKGTVQIVNNQDRDNIIVYSELGDGDFFGDLALVDDSDRSATAQSSGDTRLIAFFRPEMQAILTRFPALGNKIMVGLAEVIAQRLRKTNEYLIEVQQQAAEASPAPDSGSKAETA